jgi:hypothetical protein
MDRLSELIGKAWMDHLGCDEPWYRRRSLWLMAAALAVPLGRLFPACRPIRVRAAAAQAMRRGRRS